MKIRLACRCIYFVMMLCLFSLWSLAAVNAQTDVAAQATVTVWRLNVRSGPSTQYDVLIRIKQGETYPIVGRNEAVTWWQLDVNGIKGWVNARYVSAENAVSVPVTTPVDACPYPSHVAPSCPTSQASVSVTTQPFEHGVMIWRSDTKEIYALLNNGSFFHGLDTWKGEVLVQETPPDGFLQPQMGFGRFWLDNTLTRRGLGWATGSESSYITTIENVQIGLSPSSHSIYLQLMTGQVVWLSEYSGIWGTQKGAP